MLTIGVDSHKRSLTAVAVDSMGRQQATTQVPTTCSGRAYLLDWAEALREGAPLRWGIEGSGTYGRPLAQQLARRGQDVLEVPGIATSRERKAALGVHRQKMDTSDALAIARVALREGDRLPRVFPDGVAQRCKVLSEHRDNLVVQRTRLMNQLHAQVSFLDPARMPPISATRGRAVLEQWASMTPSATDPLEQIHLQVVRQLAGLILTYDEMIRQTGCELVRLVTEATPLLVALRGSGALTAARILGEVGDVRRFASAAKFAAYCGAAPIQASSGERVRHRLSRRGNRQLNYSLHTIAVTQRRWDPRAQQYLERKIAEGKSRKEALRCLKRHLANVVYRILSESVPSTAPRAA